MPLAGGTRRAQSRRERTAARRSRGRARWRRRRRRQGQDWLHQRQPCGTVTAQLGGCALSRPPGGGALDQGQDSADPGGSPGHEAARKHCSRAGLCMLMSREKRRRGRGTRQGARARKEGGGRRSDTVSARASACGAGAFFMSGCESPGLVIHPCSVTLSPSATASWPQRAPSTRCLSLPLVARRVARCRLSRGEGSRALPLRLKAPASRMSLVRGQTLSAAVRMS